MKKFVYVLFNQKIKTNICFIITTSDK
jgi:hypothetical protein